MMKSSNSHFTRGAQLWAHNIRMCLQGVKNICLFGTICVVLFLLYRVSQYMTFEVFYYFVIEQYVSVKLSVMKMVASQKQGYVTFYSLMQHKWVTLRLENYIWTFWNTPQYTNVIHSFSMWAKGRAIYESIYSFIVGIFMATALFVYKGRNVLQDNKLRGSQCVTPKELRGILKRKRVASKIQISGLPLVKNTETQHLLITGTTGSGKTNMINELLPQIRMQGQRAIIVDITGTFVERFYREDKDVILNPIDGGNVSWLPWNDCDSDEEFNNLASAFVDGESITSDKYWEEAARKVLEEALKKGASDRSIESMLDVIGKKTLGELSAYFEGTYAAAFVSKETEKASASVRATLLNKIERLKYLKDGGTFSIKEWVNSKNDNGWLFITSTPNQLDTLRPLISAWCNIVIKGLFDRSPSDINENTWLILDELPAMQKIPSLNMGLAQGRKYGLCTVAGIQNIAQLERIYGNSGSRELLDLFRTKFFFAVSDNQIAEYASKSLGEIEIEETRESISYGSNTMRDGVNINTTNKVRRVVLADELKNLTTRTCFVKLCGEYPVAKLKVKLQAQSRLLVGLFKFFS